MDQKRFKDAVRFCLENRFPTLAVGAPGVGKTQIIQQVCEEMGIECLISHPVTSDPPDYKGLPFPSKDGETAKFLPYGDLAKLMVADKPIVFFLDDLGQAPAAVQAACMQLLSARRINDKKIAESVIILAATNRREDRAGVQGILEPVKSRFASILYLEPKVNAWVKWATDAGMPNELISFVLFKPEVVENFKPIAQIANQAGPRTLEAAGRIMNQNPPKEIERDLLVGAVGEGAATEILAFKKRYMSLPSYEEVIDDPKGIRLPIMNEDASELFALCAMVANRALKKDLLDIAEFMVRVDPEYQTAMWVLMVARDERFCETVAFTRWAENNTELMTRVI